MVKQFVVVPEKEVERKLETYTVIKPSGDSYNYKKLTIHIGNVKISKCKVVYGYVPVSENRKVPCILVLLEGEGC